MYRSYLNSPAKPEACISEFKTYLVSGETRGFEIIYNQGVAFIPWKDYQKTIPKKRMGAGVLFFDKAGKVLLLKTSYTDKWTVPGGACEKDESPRQTAEREVKEEIGLDINLKQMVAVSYNRAKQDVDENLQWWFFGGALGTNEIGQISLDGDEITEYRFVTPKEAQELGRRNFSKISPLIMKAIKNKSAIYLEDWEVVM